MNALLQQPFMQVALPIVITLIVAAFINNARIADLRSDTQRSLGELRDDMKQIRAEIRQGFDDVNRRLERIEHKLDDHEGRMVRLEERTSPLHR